MTVDDIALAMRYELSDMSTYGLCDVRQELSTLPRCMYGMIVTHFSFILP